MGDIIMRVDIRLRKDMNGSPFYDLYMDGKYVDSFVDINKAKEKLKELCV